jgi:hypothetical protein
VWLTHNLPGIDILKDKYQFYEDSMKEIKIDSLIELDKRNILFSGL